MRQKKTPYLTNEELAEALEESQSVGHPTEKVCQLFLMIATHLLGDSRYRRYPKDMQEDMVSSALLKCVKNIHNYKPERAATCFNYYTRCTEHAFWECLGKHYKQMNIQRELTLRYADKIEHFDPKAAKTIRENQIIIEKETKK